MCLLAKILTSETKAVTTREQLPLVHFFWGRWLLRENARVYYESYLRGWPRNFWVISKAVSIIAVPLLQGDLLRMAFYMVFISLPLGRVVWLSLNGQSAASEHQWFRTYPIPIPTVQVGYETLTLVFSIVLTSWDAVDQLGMGCVPRHIVWRK